MYILIAGARTRERQTKEPREKQPRSKRKQRLKLHLHEQVTSKIARWFLERNRWHFTCQQRVLCNRKTSKRPLHCHSLMDLVKQLTLVEKKKKVTKHRRDNVPKRPAEVSRRSICRPSPWTPQSFRSEFQSTAVGKDPQNCLLDPNSVSWSFWENSKFWRGTNLQAVFTVVMNLGLTRLEVTTSLMTDLSPSLLPSPLSSAEFRAHSYGILHSWSPCCRGPEITHWLGSGSKEACEKVSSHRVGKSTPNWKKANLGGTEGNS